MSGFAKTGIHPFDKMKFHGQYSAAAVTERDLDSNATHTSADNSITVPNAVALTSDLLAHSVPSSSREVNRSPSTADHSYAVNTEQQLGEIDRSQQSSVLATGKPIMLSC